MKQTFHIFIKIQLYINYKRLLKFHELQIYKTKHEITRPFRVITKCLSKKLQRNVLKCTFSHKTFQFTQNKDNVWISNEKSSEKAWDEIYMSKDTPSYSSPSSSLRFSPLGVAKNKEIHKINRYHGNYWTQPTQNDICRNEHKKNISNKSQKIFYSNYIYWKLEIKYPYQGNR